MLAEIRYDRARKSRTRVIALDYAAVGLAALPFFWLIAGGANDSVTSSLAATIQLAFAGVLLIVTKPRGKLAIVPGVALAAFVASLALGAAPLIAGSSSAAAPDLIAPALLKLAGYAASVIAVMALATTPRRRRLMVATCIACGLLFILISIFHDFFQSPDAMTAPHYEASGRFMGAVANANAMATVAGTLALLGMGGMIASWPVGGIYALNSRGLLRVGACLMLLILATSVIGLAESRITAIATLILSVVLIAPFRKGGRRLPAIAALCALALSAILFAWRVVGRFDGAHYDWALRMSVYKRLIRTAAQAPLWGYGLGSFREINTRGLEDGSGWDWGAAHNIVLQALLECGAPFALGILATFVVILANCLGNYSRWHEDAMIRACFLSIVLVLVIAMFDIPLDVPAISSLWALLLGLVWRVSLSADGSTDSEGTSRRA